MKIHSIVEIRELINDLSKKPSKVESLTQDQKTDILEFVESEKITALKEACRLVEANNNYSYPGQIITIDQKTDYWIYKQIGHFLEIENLINQPLQKESDRPVRNDDGILRKDKTGNKYPARVFALADYLLKVVNSPKADPFIDTSSRKILNNYGLTRFGVNDFYNAYYNFIPHKFNQFKNKKEHWSELAKLQNEEKAKRPEFHKELQAAILDITNNDTDISDWFMGVNRL